MVSSDARKEWIDPHYEIVVSTGRKFIITVAINLNDILSSGKISMIILSHNLTIDNQVVVVLVLARRFWILIFGVRE